MSMNTWKKLYEYVRTLSESRQFHGKTAIRLKDLQKLGEEIGVEIDPNGGSVRTEYEFNTSIWKPWYPNMGPAIAVASTQDKRDVQSGKPQGGTIHKTNWGGKVGNVPAPIRPHANDQLGSTMDRYDVLMVAEIEERFNTKGRPVTDGTLTRLCWSPSIGSQQEREARLQALVAGKPPATLSRRPQGVVPSTSRDEEERWAAQKKNRDAADRAASEPSTSDPDDVQQGTRGGGASNSAFRDRLAQHNKEYQPEPRRKDREPDPEDALFWTPDKRKK
jgi:hypothetical protein